MKATRLIFFFLISSLSLPAQVDSPKHGSYCAFEPYTDFWQCINKNIQGNEAFRKSYIFYFQAIHTTTGYEIIFHKGEMDLASKSIIENTLDCKRSKSELRNDVKLIFFHSHNGGILTPEEYTREIEKFKMEHNIAKNICVYRISTSYRN